MARASDEAAFWAGMIRRYRQRGPTRPRSCRQDGISFHSLGRRNRPFAVGEGAGRTAAILFSLASRCRAPEMDPFDVPDRVCIHPASRVGEMLPDRWRALGSGPSSAQAG